MADTIVLNLLARHQPADEAEAESVATIQRLAQEHDILDQESAVGHVTGSALVIDGNSGKFLLHFHKIFSLWLQFGGHMEPGELDPAETAYREAVEESGLPDLQFFPNADMPQLIDVDAHVIGAKDHRPEHLHLDFRYVLVTQQPDKVELDETESDEFRWLTLAEIEGMAGQIDAGLIRLIHKASRLFS